MIEVTLMGILPYTRDAEMLRSLLAILAIISIVVWCVVVLSSVVRFGAKIWYHVKRGKNQIQP